MINAAQTGDQRLAIDVVSDVACPWCFIGKHNLDTALQRLHQRRPEVTPYVYWVPFLLSPDTPPEGVPYRPILEKKFGGPAQLQAIWARIAETGRSAGIAFAFDKIELRVNTLNAHRLIHRFQQRGQADAVVERLFSANFERGENINDPAVLARIAVECGDDPAGAQAFLASADASAEVLVQARHAQEGGISGVPFFIFNGRQALSGAQPVEVLLEAMEQILDVPAEVANRTADQS
ncbi:MAG: DsbA family oxidoreductase [Pseudomonadota bacterium]